MLGRSKENAGASLVSHMLHVDAERYQPIRGHHNNAGLEGDGSAKNARLAACLRLKALPGFRG